MTSAIAKRSTSTTILAGLIEAPDLVRRVRALPPEAFSSLLRRIGIEDAGEIVALATTEQLVAAFDEDLFVNAAPGEREEFDPARFVVWLEVLLEAGDTVAASRVAELSEDFVVHAISSLVLVLDHDALLARMGEGGRAARSADKALESALAEEIDGYLLLSRRHEGWDAVLSLIVALDRDHRSLLERLLDRCAAIASEYVDDLDALVTALTAEESLAEDVEAAREERRSAQGHVEPRAARSFLALARTPVADVATEQRDPLTRAYFRDLDRRAPTARRQPGATGGWLGLDGDVAAGLLRSAPGMGDDHEDAGAPAPLVEAMLAVRATDPERFAERMEELAYLANVLVAGARVGEGRMNPSDAAEAALATVSLGAEIVALERRPARERASARATGSELRDVVRTTAADLLFRKATSAVANLEGSDENGVFLTREDAERALERLVTSPRRRARAARRSKP